MRWDSSERSRREGWLHSSHAPTLNEMRSRTRTRTSPSDPIGNGTEDFGHWGMELAGKMKKVREPKHEGRERRSNCPEISTSPTKSRSLSVSHLAEAIVHGIARALSRHRGQGTFNRDTGRVWCPQCLIAGEDGFVALTALEVENVRTKADSYVLPCLLGVWVECQIGLMNKSRCCGHFSLYRPAKLGLMCQGTNLHGC